jgi:hypothetical protein
MTYSYTPSPKVDSTGDFFDGRIGNFQVYNTIGSVMTVYRVSRPTDGRCSAAVVAGKVEKASLSSRISNNQSRCCDTVWRLTVVQSATMFSKCGRDLARTSRSSTVVWFLA